MCLAPTASALAVVCLMVFGPVIWCSVSLWFLRFSEKFTVFLPFLLWLFTVPNSVVLLLFCAGDSQADLAAEFPRLSCKDPPGWQSGDGRWRGCHPGRSLIFFWRTFCRLFYFRIFLVQGCFISTFRLISHYLLTYSFFTLPNQQHPNTSGNNIVCVLFDINLCKKNSILNTL